MEFVQRKRCDVCEDAVFEDTDFLWCYDCKLFLCSSCEITKHKKIKFDIPHCVRSLTSKPKDLGICCLDHHHNEFDRYCISHDVLCCKICQESCHVNCDYISFPSTYSGRSNFATKIDVLYQNAVDAHDIIYNSIISKKNKLNSLYEKRNEISLAIQKLRINLNESLDKAEKRLLTTFAETCQYEHINELLNELEDREQHILAIKDQLSDLKSFSETTASYKNLQPLESALENEKILIIKALLKQVDAVDVELIPSSHFIYQSIESQLNEIKVVKHKRCIDSSSDRRNLNCTLPNYVLQHALTFDVQQKDGNAVEIRDCTITTFGRFVFSDMKNEAIYIHNCDGTFLRKLKVSGCPRFISNFNGETIAANINKDGISVICIFDIERDHWQDILAFPEICSGISYFEDKLIVRIGGYGYHLYNVGTGGIINKIPFAGSNTPYVSLDKNAFYFADWKTGHVVCSDFKGRILWKCQDDILKSPNGITTDLGGKVFVAGSLSNNIVLIRENGRNVQELVSANEFQSFNCPLGIHYDKQFEKLLVSFTDGKVVVYALSCSSC